MSNIKNSSTFINRISGGLAGDGKPAVAAIQDGTKLVDTHNGYSTGSNVYTVPMDGVYQITSSYTEDVNGIQQVKGETATVYKRAGDYIDIQVFNWTSYSHGSYKKSGSTITVNINKNTFEVNGGRWWDLLPEGFSVTDAQKVLYRPTDLGPVVSVEFPV